MRRAALGSILVALLASCLACGGGGGDTPPPPSPPVIQGFTATPSPILAGEPATLSWTVAGATALRLDPGYGDVMGRSSQGVAPATTVSYTLTASNAGGSVSATTTLTVAAALTWTAQSIPVRDGRSLAADLYFAGSAPTAKPVILIQTPYDKGHYRDNTVPGPAGGASFPKSASYNVVVVDWRGFYGSADAAVAGYDRGLDGYDCVEWIARQPWCNGKVGTWGSSALGAIQWQTARHQPPHLVCCTVQVRGIATRYEQYYCGGAWRREHVQSMALLGLVDLENVLAHPAKDALWQAAEAASDYTADIRVPVLVVGGWYDHFPMDVLDAFEGLRTRGAADLRSRHKLVMGPWTHSGVGQSVQGVFTYPDATGIQDTTLQFWDAALRGVANGWEAKPPVSYYQMGENRWLFADSWTGLVRQERSLYLHPGGLLQPFAPPAGAAPESFRYDPADPTPALGGSRFNPFNPLLLEGPQDLGQVIEPRADVRVYSTPLLDQDLVLNGSLALDLWVASDRTDTDFSVRLTDVQPDGRSIILTQGIRRLRFRESLTREVLAVPGQAYPLTIDLPDLAYTFLKGHRLRLVVASADHPHFDRNRNDGGPMYVPGPFLPAQNTVFQDAGRPSRFRFQAR